MLAGKHYLMSSLSCTDPALFVYLAWNTRSDQDILSDDETRQAAYLAIIRRTRSQRCHVLAIGGTDGGIHLIAQFPPSMPIATVARVAQDAGSQAIAMQAEAFGGHEVSRDHLWERGFLAHTLRPTDFSDPESYLRQQIVSPNGQLALSFV